MNVIIPSITIAIAVGINALSSLFTTDKVTIRESIKKFNIALDDSIANQKIGVIINECIKKEVINIFTNKYNLIKDDRFPDIDMKFFVNKYNVDKKSEKNGYSEAILNFDIVVKYKSKSQKYFKDIERKLEIETSKENNVEEIISTLISDYMKEFIERYLMNKK